MNFYECAIPEQRQILGLPLRPLSMGHIVLLNRIKSAFVTEGVPPSYEEIAIAALICSLNYQDGLKAITDPETPKFLRYLANRITGLDRFWVRVGLLKSRKIDLPALCSVFSDYLAEHTKMPHYTYTEADFQEIAAPSVQLVKIALMMETNLTESDIMDRSWLMCLWDYVTIKAIKGEVRMVEEEKIDRALEVAKKLEELVKSGGIRC